MKDEGSAHAEDTTEKARLEDYIVTRRSLTWLAEADAVGSTVVQSSLANTNAAKSTSSGRRLCLLLPAILDATFAAIVGGWCMKRLLLAAAFLLVAFEASAVTRYDIDNMTCAQIQALLAADGVGHPALSFDTEFQPAALRHLCERPAILRQQRGGAEDRRAKHRSQILSGLQMRGEQYLRRSLNGPSKETAPQCDAVLQIKADAEGQL